MPLALLLISVTWFAAHGPSPFGLARLLDDKLGLNDRLATALEIEARGGEESSLERRTVADAAALLRAGREDWRASAAEAGREWWAPVGAVALLAIVIAVGAATGSSSSSGPTSALGPHGGGGAGGPNGLDNEYVKHSKDHKKGGPQLAPTGKLHKLDGKKIPREPDQGGSGERGLPADPAGQSREQSETGRSGQRQRQLRRRRQIGENRTSTKAPAAASRAAAAAKKANAGRPKARTKPNTRPSASTSKAKKRTGRAAKATPK